MKPKQPLSAYFIFSNERRAALVAENKNVLEVCNNELIRTNDFWNARCFSTTIGGLWINQNIYFLLKIAKITGEEWKNMTEKEKAPYEQVGLRFSWLIFLCS